MRQLPADRTGGTECRACNLQANRADRAAVGRGAAGREGTVCAGGTVSVSEPEGLNEAGERGEWAARGSLLAPGALGRPGPLLGVGPTRGCHIISRDSAFWGVAAQPPHSLSFSSGLLDPPGSDGLGSEVGFYL